MASITAVSRCAGLNHVNFTVLTTAGATKQITIMQDDLNIQPRTDDDVYVAQRIALLVREARSRGAVSFAQIRTDLLGREFVE